MFPEFIHPRKIHYTVVSVKSKHKATVNEECLNPHDRSIALLEIYNSFAIIRYPREVVQVFRAEYLASNGTWGHSISFQLFVRVTKPWE
jgi:hypothetical protein